MMKCVLKKIGYAGLVMLTGFIGIGEKAESERRKAKGNPSNRASRIDFVGANPRVRPATQRQPKSQSVKLESRVSEHMYA
jgi:hypothetical protein